MIFLRRVGNPNGPTHRLASSLSNASWPRRRTPPSSRADARNPCSSSYSEIATRRSSPPPTCEARPRTLAAASVCASRSSLPSLAHSSAHTFATSSGTGRSGPTAACAEHRKQRIWDHHGESRRQRRARALEESRRGVLSNVDTGDSLSRQPFLNGDACANSCVEQPQHRDQGQYRYIRFSLSPPFRANTRCGGESPRRRSCQSSRSSGSASFPSARWEGASSRARSTMPRRSTAPASATLSRASRWRTGRRIRPLSICWPGSQRRSRRPRRRSGSRGCSPRSRGLFPSRAAASWSAWTRTSERRRSNSRRTTSVRSKAPHQRSPCKGPGTQNTWNK